MLESLKLRNIGPSPQMDFAFSPRMNLLTGDNGLGKTFVLDLVWWACTGSWAERAIEAAEALMRGDHGALPADLATQEAIHAELLRVLAGHDPFWPRWIVRQGGVEE